MQRKGDQTQQVIQKKIAPIHIKLPCHRHLVLMFPDFFPFLSNAALIESFRKPSRQARIDKKLLTIGWPGYFWVQHVVTSI